MVLNILVTPIKVITAINPYKKIFVTKIIDFSSFATSSKFTIVKELSFSSIAVCNSVVLLDWIVIVTSSEKSIFLNSFLLTTRYPPS